MGGDHKCPVCQATFTRPQHVARHMRSHTGDRPYKCQHCGDQFARSDLLSRHVNKCHANEKPPPTTGNTRRKGSASVSRAITSKQACDQCVQSSLPCDGSNPCAKCVQRKCRCTFVKFHRQTAPVGPGHTLRPSSSCGRLSTHPPTDNFILGTTPSLGPAVTENLYSHQFAFPQIFPPDSQDPSFARITPDASDFMQRYRAQTELLRRASLDHAGHIGPALYSDPQATSSWVGWPQQISSDSNFNDNSSLDAPCLLDDTTQFAPDPNALSRHVMDQQEYQYPGQPLRSPPFSMIGIDAFRKGRRASLDLSSDSSHPSSATSSNAHLPLDAPSVHPQQISHHEVSGQNNYSAVMPPQNQSQRGSLLGEGGFSSAFGLMSLDDPNVLAGLSNDGVPYFSATNMSMYAEDPNATPMPTKQGSNNPRSNPYGGLNTSSLREAETRELREFWKTYMRTPLGGPSPAALEASATTGTHLKCPSSPSLSHRRVRVNSLPTAKTPTTEGVKPYYPNGTNNAPGANATSSIRTTLHGNVDDLRSYEAAVLALKAPTLHMPKRRANASLSPRAGDANTPRVAPLGGASAADFHRPCSASSVSSLAHAFGKSAQGQHHHALLDGEAKTRRRSPSSRESSLSLTGDDSTSDMDVLRPSFKRLPSQTLGPDKTKRTFLSRHGAGGDQEEGGGGGGVGDVVMGDRAIKVRKGEAGGVSKSHGEHHRATVRSALNGEVRR